MIAILPRIAFHFLLAESGGFVDLDLWGRYLVVAASVAERLALFVAHGGDFEDLDLWGRYLVVVASIAERFALLVTGHGALQALGLRGRFRVAALDVFGFVVLVLVESGGFVDLHLWELPGAVLGSGAAAVQARVFCGLAL